jgi:hypothetical protein
MWTPCQGRIKKKPQGKFTFFVFFSDVSFRLISQGMIRETGKGIENPNDVFLWFGANVK